MTRGVVGRRSMKGRVHSVHEDLAGKTKRASEVVSEALVLDSGMRWAPRRANQIPS